MNTMLKVCEWYSIIMRVLFNIDHCIEICRTFRRLSLYPQANRGGCYQQLLCWSRCTEHILFTTHCVSLHQLLYIIVPLLQFNGKASGHIHLNQPVTNILCLKSSALLLHFLNSQAETSAFVLFLFCIPRRTAYTSVVVTF